MTSQSARPVFIVGSPRSGTTWLYHLLLSSGGFAIYRSETQFYSRFGPSFGWMRRSVDRRAFLDHWLRSEFFLRAGLGIDEFRDAAIEAPRSTGEFLRLFMDRICQVQGAERWADCTPDHGLYIREIKREFPDALFIHMHRDGRDVAMSLARQRFVPSFPWQHDTPEIAAAAYWSWTVRRVLKETRFLAADYMEIRYESLVESFDACLARLSEFLGRRMDSARIQQSPIGAVTEPNTSFEGKTAGRARWQTDLDTRLLGRIERIMAPELEELGYDAETLTGQSFAGSHPLERQLYALRWDLGKRIKDLGMAARQLPELSVMTTGRVDEDPTLRPGENIEHIRSLVGR
ncbi:MAG: sulfotransferase [Pseudomonadota bacterium]